MTDSDLHIVYNFFEKIQKPPAQESYLDGMKFIFEYVRKQPSFRLGQLHKNIDPNGLYKYVNYVGFGNGDFHVFAASAGKPPPQEWMQTVTQGIGPRGHQVSYPGGYLEVATLTGEPMCTQPPKAENSCYLLINYRETGVGEANFGDFEANWQTKTGATLLSETLQGDVKVGQMGFYKRLPGRSPFIYVLRCEVLPGSSQEQVLAQLSLIREKLGAAGIPFSDVAAYDIAYLCTPKP